MRNLDLNALRSLVAVAETGGVTRAAGMLNLTQSAVSMQLKRLEEGLGVALLNRTGRGVAFTGNGEQLLGYARRMLALNDEIHGRLTDTALEGEIALGVPSDLVQRAIPGVLKTFHAAYPRMRVNLVSACTRNLKSDFAAGVLDMTLTTETAPVAGAETLVQLPLVWVGAPGGSAWRSRPVRFATEDECAFRPVAIRALEAAGIPWEVGLEAVTTAAVEVGVEADLAIYVQMAGMAPPSFEVIPTGDTQCGRLPDLPVFAVNLYRSARAVGPAQDALADMLAQAYAAFSPRS